MNRTLLAGAMIPATGGRKAVVTSPSRIEVWRARAFSALCGPRTTFARESRSRSGLPRIRSACVLLAAVVLTTMLFLVSSVPAISYAAPYNWEYAYDAYNNPGWGYSQATYTLGVGYTASRWWPAQGYDTSSTYYRLLSSLDSYFPNAIRSAANTWSAQDPLFHFSELAPNGNNFDHTMGMANLGGYVGMTYGGSIWNSSKTRAEINPSWYTRFAADQLWTNGTTPSTRYDRQSVATHELGHSVKLDDLVGDWTPATEPTMEHASHTGSIYQRSLEAGDILGITKLY